MKPLAENFSLQETIDSLRKKYGQHLKVEIFTDAFDLRKKYGQHLKPEIFTDTFKWFVLIDPLTDSCYITGYSAIYPYAVTIFDEKIF
jgi:hypothetical protein